MYNPIVLKNHGGNPLSEKEIEERLGKTKSITLKDIISDMEKNNLEYDGLINSNCRPEPLKIHKVEIRDLNEFKNPWSLKNLFSKKD